MAMTIDKARELLATQVKFGGYYNRNSARMILADVQREHGIQAADSLIAEFNLQDLFGIEPGVEIKTPGSNKN